MTYERAARVRTAAEGLALRDALLRYLGATDVAAALPPLVQATPDDWAFVLRVECCALPLMARLRRDGVFDSFDEPRRATLLAAEAREAQRVLGARQVALELDHVASDVGTRLVLLKGAAAAADPRRQPVDLGDVDVLVTPAATEPVWDALRARGWSPVVTGVSPTDHLGDRMHYAPLRAPRHQLPIELHARFGHDASGNAPAVPHAPIPGHRALDRQTGAPALLATLRHSVEAHPHRRGHLRDLFLLAELVAELDDAEREQLACVASSAGLVEQHDMLDQARALRNRESSLHDSAALRPFVVYKYANAAGTTALLRGGPAGWSSLLHLPLEAPARRRAAFRELLRQAFRPVPAESSLLRRRGLQSRLSTSLQLPRVIRAGYRSALIAGVALTGGLLRRHVRALDHMSRRR